MSYAYYDHPDITHQCCLCKRFDCSGPDEKWLHLLTVETDGGYRPAIGHKCLSEMYANGEFAKLETVTYEVVRGPNDEEIGAYVRDLVDKVRSIPIDNDAEEVKPVDVPDTNARSAATRKRSATRQRKAKVGEGKS